MSAAYLSFSACIDREKKEVCMEVHEYTARMNASRRWPEEELFPMEKQTEAQKRKTNDVYKYGYVEEQRENRSLT